MFEQTIALINKINTFPMSLVNFTIGLVSKLNKKPKQKSEYKLEEIEMLIKKSPSPSTDFMKNFDVHKTHEVFTGTTSMLIERVRQTPPMKMNSHAKEVLKNSIVISLSHVVDRVDLEFVGFSKLDHQPIYRYIGNNFSEFDLPYTEMVTAEIPLPPRQQPRSYGRKLPIVSKTDLEQL